jgi:hypothetical protein
MSAASADKSLLGISTAASPEDLLIPQQIFLTHAQTMEQQWS